MGLIYIVEAPTIWKAEMTMHNTLNIHHGTINLPHLLSVSGPRNPILVIKGGEDHRSQAALPYSTPGYSLLARLSKIRKNEKKKIKIKKNY